MKSYGVLKTLNLSNCIKLKNLIEELNILLQTSEIKDKSQNGLQVEGKNEVRKVSFAVDACYQSFERAIESQSDLLIVHHGLFWSDPLLITGNHYRRIKLLIENGLSLYASHLPLDLHPEIGNNIQILKLLGLDSQETFGDYHGVKIGFTGTYKTKIKIVDFLSRVKKIFNSDPKVFQFGPDTVKNIAVISGGAANLINQTENTLIDTFVTGEPLHEIFHYASEIGKNLICAGHYATETQGLKALEEYIKSKFSLETHFINLPTGL